MVCAAWRKPRARSVSFSRSMNHRFEWGDIGVAPRPHKGRCQCCCGSEPDAWEGDDGGAKMIFGPGSTGGTATTGAVVLGAAETVGDSIGWATVAPSVGRTIGGQLATFGSASQRRYFER